jgi:peroxiredoxin
MMKRIAFVAVLLGLTVSFGGAQDSPVFFVPERTPTAAPAFTLPDLTGRSVGSAALAGKVAVLSFGATWCTTCTSELKSLENLQAKFPKDLVVYFVALDGRGEKDVKPYMDKHGHRVPTLIDPRMAVAQEYGIRWIPVTVIVDRQGTIVGRAIGAREWDGKEAVELVQSLLKR